MPEAWEYLMSLALVNDKENHQNHFHEYKILNQRQRGIWEVTQQFREIQEQAHRYATFQWNV